jgi:ATP-dependent Clp protease ATP-binding subunit ClpC
LARGEIQLIGATTFEEYKNSIEKDGAMSRRFQKITVKEPTVSETETIVLGLAKKYASFHKIDISEQAVKLTVSLAERYIFDFHFPDKALDLLDQACSLAKINGLTELTPDILYQTVSKRTGIPCGNISDAENNKLKTLEEKIKQTVFGQDEAVKQVVSSVKRMRLGIKDDKRPAGSFIFMGNSGVGKTLLAQVLAKELFYRNDSLIKIDMSEFAEKHSISGLIGAPSGYVGYDKGGILTEQVRRKPYSVVLFDEIEKADPDIYNLLLQILEDGCLTDREGRKIDFSNTFVIMTTNIGIKNSESKNALGFGAKPDSTKEICMKNLKDFLSPEILNRVDEIVFFNTLDKESLKKAIKKEVKSLKDRFNKIGCTVSITESCIEKLAEMCKDSQAREIRQLVRRKIENPICDLIIEAGIGDFKVTARGTDFSIKKVPSNNTSVCQMA